MATSVYAVMRHQRPSGVPIFLKTAGCDPRRLIFIRREVDKGKISDWRPGEGLQLRGNQIVSQILVAGRS